MGEGFTQKTFLIVFVVVLALLGVGGYFMVMQLKQGEMPIIEEPAVIRSLRDDWKIYKNNDFNFEIGYPSNFVFREDTIEEIKRIRLELYVSEEWFGLRPVAFNEISVPAKGPYRPICNRCNKDKGEI